TVRTRGRHDDPLSKTDGQTSHSVQKSQLVLQAYRGARRIAIRRSQFENYEVSQPPRRRAAYFKCERMNASAFSWASATSFGSPPPRPWPAPRITTNSCDTCCWASSAAMASD